MTIALKIDIVSDVSCPWCIIGYRALDIALGNLQDQISADIHWQPFELNPDMPPEGQQLAEHIMQKYGSSREQSAGARQMLSERGQELGFEFNFQEDSRIYNTFDAHRLLHWAHTQGKQTALKLALFDLYFHRGGNPSDHSDLCRAAGSAGLDEKIAMDVLQSARYAGEVRALEAQYREKEIYAVPTFIINDQYQISGGQGVDVFEHYLRKLITKLQPQLS